jgi:hypothetical protein
VHLQLSKDLCLTLLGRFHSNIISDSEVGLHAFFIISSHFTQYINSNIIVLCVRV